MLQQRHLAEHNVVSLLGQLVLDGAVLGPPEQELLHQGIQLALPGSSLLHELKFESYKHW